MPASTFTITSTKPISPRPTSIKTATTTTTTTATTTITPDLYYNSLTPTPRSTPFSLEQFGFEEYDENESIVSDVDLLLLEQQDFIPTTQPPHQPHTSKYHTIVNTISPHKILSQYFATELFYANNLLQISNHFINREFDSFNNDLILNPNIPKTNHLELINQLTIMYNETMKLVETIEQFNQELDDIIVDNYTIHNLQNLKMSYNEKLDIHLNVPVHEIVDKIIDGLYQYNLTVEDLLEDEQEKEKEKEVVEVEEELSNEDKKSIDKIKTYHDKILSILNLQDEKFTIEKVEKFHNILQYEIIENKEWQSVVKLCPL